MNLAHPAADLSATGPLLAIMDIVTDGVAAAEIIKATALFVAAATPLVAGWLKRRRPTAKSTRKKGVRRRPRAAKTRRRDRT